MTVGAEIQYMHENSVLWNTKMEGTVIIQVDTGEN